MTTQELVKTDGKPLIELREKEPTFMQLLSFAVQNNGAVDVIERLAALQEKTMAKAAEAEFNDAMKAAQDEISEIIPDMENAETKKRYASFKALNRAVRPVYLKHGFDLSFNAAPSEKPEEIHVICDVSHIGKHTKQYMIPMPTDGKGAKGGGVMSKSHATLAATSYGRSCLVRLIFNLAIDDDAAAGMDKDELKDHIDRILKCGNVSELFVEFKKSFTVAEEINDVKAQIALSEAKDIRKKELQDARTKS